jgi:ABC-type multidrug transport system fused ATPase/permease subunit
MPVFEIYRKILSLLDPRERRQFWLLTGVMILVAAAEVLGMTAVLVLLNVLAEPGSIKDNAVLAFLYDGLGFESTFTFQIAISILVFAVVMFGIAVKAAGSYAISIYATMRGYAISRRLLGTYLRQPYIWFLERNSAEIGKNVLSEVDGLVGRVITPALRLIANILLVLSILGFLLFVDPLVTLFSGGVLGLAYSLIYLRLRNGLRRAGDELVEAMVQRFRVAQEATGGIKDVKVLGKEDSYLAAYSGVAFRAARATARIGLMSEMPRFALEALSFGTLLSLILVLLLRSGGSISDIVPMLGVIAYSTMRLLPSLQQIYFGLSSIRGATSALDIIVDDYALVKEQPPPEGTNGAALPLVRQLELSDVSFAYPTANRAAVHELSLTIAARTTVGIVGGTGAGKTSLVDLILGLLRPDSGEIRVDGTVISGSTVPAWQKTLGYVPQSIFLTDDSVAANIAFGVAENEIDMAAVERAARTAALHDFVTTELPLGYRTLVGERGVRLSGGQRQRIGIARALYRNPTMLIMDEATSALDNITERVVMDAVQRIRSDKTIILIAHRLSTVRTCDTIFLMERGRVLAQGTYDELLSGNEVFRRMVAGDATAHEPAA